MRGETVEGGSPHAGWPVPPETGYRELTGGETVTASPVIGALNAGEQTASKHAEVVE